MGLAAGEGQEEERQGLKPEKGGRVHLSNRSQPQAPGRTRLGTLQRHRDPAQEELHHWG